MRCRGEERTKQCQDDVDRAPTDRVTQRSGEDTYAEDADHDARGHRSDVASPIVWRRDRGDVRDCDLNDDGEQPCDRQTDHCDDAVRRDCGDSAANGSE